MATDASSPGGSSRAGSVRHHNGGMLAFGPKAGCTSRWATAAPPAIRRTAPRTALALRQAALPERCHEGCRIEALGSGTRGASRSTGQWRPLHRRRRPGQRRGDRLHAGEEPRPGELRLGRLRGRRQFEDKPLGAGKLVMPVARTPTATAARSPAATSIAARTLRCAAATSTATTAAGTSGASRSLAARRRLSGGSRFRSRASRRSARTTWASSTESRTAARFTA